MNSLVNPVWSAVKGKGEGPGMVDERPVADILVRQGQHGAGTQAVPGRQPAGAYIVGFTGNQKAFPQVTDFIRFQKNLEPELAGVSGGATAEWGVPSSRRTASAIGEASSKCPLKEK